MDKYSTMPYCISCLCTAYIYLLVVIEWHNKRLLFDITLLTYLENGFV